MIMATPMLVKELTIIPICDPVAFEEKKQTWLIDLYFKNKLNKSSYKTLENCKLK